jgi:uncharacterized protein YecT (DUF1311 family)
MKKITLFAFLLLSIITNGQMSLGDSLATLPCTEAETQIEMNECSALQLQIAEEMLMAVFTEIKNSYEENLAGLIASGADPDLIKAAKDQQQSFVNAQVLFEQYRDSMANTYSLGYYGGSMAPLIYNVVCTQLTVERFELLKQIQAEFY